MMLVQTLSKLLVPPMVLLSPSTVAEAALADFFTMRKLTAVMPLTVWVAKNDARSKRKYTKRELLSLSPLLESVSESVWSAVAALRRTKALADVTISVVSARAVTTPKQASTPMMYKNFQAQRVGVECMREDKRFILGQGFNRVK